MAPKKSATIRPRKSPPRTIYVLKINDDLIKGGITTNLKRRLYQYKHQLGYTPDVIFSKEVPYRCARCIEFGLLWNFEYISSDQTINLIRSIEKALEHSGNNPCGKENLSTKGLSAYSFYHSCGLKMTAAIHSFDGAPSVSNKNVGAK